jgi:hypothetical protein
MACRPDTRKKGLSRETKSCYAARETFDDSVQPREEGSVIMAVVMRYRTGKRFSSVNLVEADSVDGPTNVSFSATLRSDGTVEPEVSVRAADDKTPTYYRFVMTEAEADDFVRFYTEVKAKYKAGDYRI